MNPETRDLRSTTASFTLAAAITIIFNTVLACAKDASAPLTKFMNSLLGHNWTTQGIADIVVFLVLGLSLSKTPVINLDAERITSVLIWSVVLASLGLASWYVLF